MQAEGVYIMKIVRRKKFSSFIEGKNEVLNIIPLQEMCYFELANCNNYEDTFNKLKIHDIYLLISRDKDEFIFTIVFMKRELNHLQTLLGNREWEVVEDECRGLTQYEMISLLNNKW
jgi:hypothetical protein